MLQHALKEWAVICRALAEGKQSILLRKGGIAETSGRFDVEHTRFWLFPTFVHQQREGGEALGWLQEEEQSRPEPGKVRLSHWAEVTGIYRVHDLLPALMLAHLHYWSDQAVEKRFAYREPGVDVLAVRVYRAPETHVIADTAAYQGCKSWVELDEALPTSGSTPVLDDKQYHDLRWNLDTLLRPTALA